MKARWNTASLASESTHKIPLICFDDVVLSGSLSSSSLNSFLNILTASESESCMYSLKLSLSWAPKTMLSCVY